jgi:predicted MPP superfamily phosphohydrolase
MLEVILIAVLGPPALVAAYAILVEPRWLRIRRRVVRVPGWPSSLDGLTILHLSDLHIGKGPSTVEGFLTRVVDIPADVVVITGDFLAGVAGLEHCRRALKPLTDQREVYGILGNHEHSSYPWRLSIRGRFKARSRLDTKGIVAGLEAAGVRMLINGHASVPSRLGKVTLVGIDDLFHDAHDLRGALDGVALDEGVVLLCHSPDVLAEATRRQLPVVLSGHTHGGQVRLPGVGVATTATREPMERAAGIIRQGETVMHVSPGLGTTFLPIRLFVRPEATVLEIRSSDSLD